MKLSIPNKVLSLVNFISINSLLNTYVKFYHSYFIFCILQGEKGEQGLQGVPGAPGRDAGLFVF